ncbi:hypothetical protein [Mongoliimonas terrestris]|uniref:hypothetical protein n=1 Tax=Mongoliimonas terrestris TaxID=1709001 RepID=UPI0009495079|nr:hypothetical protein [Mongoliimonas terrestris]
MTSVRFTAPPPDETASAGPEAPGALAPDGRPAERDLAPDGRPAERDPVAMARAAMARVAAERAAEERARRERARPERTTRGGPSKALPGSDTSTAGHANAERTAADRAAAVRPAPAASRTGRAAGLPSGPARIRRVAAALSGPLAVALLVLSALAGLIAAGGWRSTLDDGFGSPAAMLRLAEVRDLSAGRDWFDFTQTRIAPGGAHAVGSRLGDGAVLAAILALRPLTGVEGAERLAVNLLPPLMLVVFGLALATAARRVAGPAAMIGTLAIVPLTPPLIGLFRPGEIDDRVFAATAFALALAGLVHAVGRPGTGAVAAPSGPSAHGRDPANPPPADLAPDRLDEAAAGALAGIATAALLLLGPGAALAAGLLVAGFSAAWILVAEPVRRGLTGFGLALAAAMPAFAAVAGTSGSDCAVPVLLFGVGGLSLAVLATLIRGERGEGAAGVLMRGGALTGVASLLTSAAAVAVPACFTGAAPVPADTGTGSGLLGTDAVLFAIYAPPLAVSVLAGLAAAWWLGTRRPAGLPPAVAASGGMVAGLAVLTSGLALGAFGVADALPLAEAASVLAAGCVIALVFAVRPARARLRSALLKGGLVLAAPPVWAVVALPLDGPLTLETAAATRAACQASVGAALADAPPGRVAAPASLGPYLLMRTDLTVLDAAATRRTGPHPGTDTVLAAPLAWAGADIAADAVAYVAFCRHGRDTADLIARAPDGLAAALQQGARPAFLAPLSETRDALVFAVRATPETTLETTGSLPPLGLRPAF